MPRTFNVGEVLTAQNTNNYLQNGLLKALRSTGGSNAYTDGTERVYTTLTNIAVGPGATINRAVKATWNGAFQQNTGATVCTIAVRAYYQSGSSFTLASATQFGVTTFDLITEFDDHLISASFYTSLAPATWSFGFTVQRTAGTTGYLVRSATSYPLWNFIEDAGDGSLITLS